MGKTRYFFNIMIFLIPILLIACGDGDNDTSNKDINNVDTIDRSLTISGDFDNSFMRTVILLSSGETIDDIPLNPIDETIPGECGGELSIYSVGQEAVTGEYDVSFIFSEFDDCESTISGELIFSGEVNTKTNIPISSLVSFQLFTVIADEEEYIVDGAKSSNFTGDQKSTTLDLQIENSQGDTADIIKFGHGYSTIKGLTFIFSVIE